MASEEKTEDELLTLDNETELTDTNESLVMDSTAEERLLSTNDSDIESLPDVDNLESQDTQASRSSQSYTPLTEIIDENEIKENANNFETEVNESSSAEVAVNSSVEFVKNNSSQPNNTGTVDSDEDIVEIVVVKNVNNINVGPKPIVPGSPEWQAERLRRMREEERKRILQSEKVSEFNFRSNRLQQQRKRTRYNLDGRPVIFADDFSFCDCLMPQCPGCHYPCKACGDARCGHECRVNRRYIYESIELEGRGITLKPPKSNS